MQSCVPDHFGMNYALYNQVQINRDYRIEDKEENNSSHEHINFYSHQLSMGKSRNDLKESQIASSIDSSQFVFKEGSKFFHDQLFEVEKYNQPNTITNDDYSKMLVVPFSSPQIVNLEVFELNGKFQENGTLLFRSKITISSRNLDPTFLQDSFHDNLILYSHQEYLSYVNSFEQSHVSNCMYYDRIADWLEYSYLEKFPGNGKIIFTLFRDQGGNFDTLILYPSDGENMERKENCQEDGALRSRPMVMSGPHNSHKLHNLIFSCFCDPYNDKIAEWLEDSYRKNVQGNGKVMLALFLNDDDKGKYDVFLSYFDILPFLLLIFDFVFIAGLELLRWLHWKHDFT
jgi:hypothetical protein